MAEELARLKNRYKAIYRSRAIDSSGYSIYNDESRIVELEVETERFVAEDLFARIQFLKKQKTEYRKRFDNYRDSTPEIKALSSIPGISSVRACIIAGIVLSPKRFANKYKFWAYCTLVKYDRRSDDQSYGKVRIQGNRILKNVFMGAAQSAIDATDNGLKKLYDGMRSEGIDHRAAKKNVARKIAAIALAVMRTKKPYRADFEGAEKKVAKKAWTLWC